MNTLIVVDVQNDFLPGGPLAVPQGDEIVPVINMLMPRFDLVVATQDWHPRDHGSFADNHAGKQAGDVVELNGFEQILWPVHCVQNTPGSEFAAQLHTRHFEHIFQKGTRPDVDSYSGFFDNGHRQATGLGDYLKQRGVSRVFLCGLATDYCVKFTALDACQLGYQVALLTDACRGVNLQPGDVDQILDDMRSRGVETLDTSKVPSQL